MPARVPRLNYRVLTAFHIVGLPLLAVALALVLGSGQARLRDTYGLHLAQVAEQTAAAVDTYIYRRVLDVALLGRVPEVRASAAEGSRAAFDAQAVRELDRRWQQPSVPAATPPSLLTNPASRFLADVVRNDPIYRELMLTDRHGRLVAASNLTSDYYQADEDWWRDAFHDGTRGRVGVSDERWDDSARAYVLDIAVPIPDPAGEGLVGIMKASADVREMLAVIGGVRLGDTGEAVLLRENGSIVHSRRATDPAARFFAADLIRERLQLLKKNEPGVRLFFRASTPEGDERLVGVAPSQLGRSYADLTWLVAVSQAEDELFAPIRAQLWALLLVIALTAVAVLALALWFSMRLAAPTFETDMELVQHPHVATVEEADQGV
jgi:hypothetical protein